MDHPIRRLHLGHRQFKRLYFQRDRELYRKLLKQGQSPKVMVIACSDSRVDPAIVFKTEPGELFVVRNVANLVPPSEDGQSYHGTSAAIEFAVTDLKIHHIIILGHSQCGGIQAALRRCREDIEPQSPLSRWIHLAEPCCREILESHPDLKFSEQADLCSQQSIASSLKRLHSFGFVKEKLNKGVLHLHGWHFDLETGSLHVYDPMNQEFCLLDIEPE